jgi:hypothetical protein
MILHDLYSLLPESTITHNTPHQDGVKVPFEQENDVNIFIKLKFLLNISKKIESSISEKCKKIKAEKK